MVVIPAKLELDTKEAEKDIKRTAEAAEDMAERLSLEDKIGMFGDLKDTFQMTATSLLGLSDASAEALTKIGDLTEKGMMIGAPFGAWGAILGGVVGAGLALLDSRSAAAQESMHKLMAQSQQLAEGQLAAARETRKLIDELDELDRFSFTGASASIEMINSAATELLEDMELIKTKQLDYQAAVAKGMTPTEEEKAAYRELGVQAELLLGKFLRLRDEREKNLPEIRTGIVGELSSAWLDVGAAMDRSKTSMSDLKGTAKTAKDNLKAARTELVDLRKEAETSTDPVALEDISKRAKDLLGTIAGLTKTFDTASDEIEKRNKEATEKMGQALVRSLQKQNKEAEKELKRYAEPRAAQMIKEYDEFTKQQDAIALAEAEAYVKREEQAAAFAKADEDFAWQVYWTKQEIADREKAERQKQLDEDIAAYTSYFNIIAGGLSEFTGQLEANIAAGNNLFADMGAAAESAVSQVLKALGRQWGLQAIAELAEAWALLGTPAAAKHFRSAAGYGAAAVGAGVGGAVFGGLAGRAGREESNSSGGGASDGFASSSAARMDSGPQDLRPIVVNFDSTIPATEREAQQVADRLRKLMGGRR